MTATSKKRRELTESEKRRAAKAKAVWLEKKKRDGLTQDDANNALGWSPSTFGQYINGRIPMNLTALLMIADYLGVSPQELGGREEAEEVEAAAYLNWRDFKLHDRMPPTKEQDVLYGQIVDVFMREVENLSNDNLVQLIEAIGRSVSPKGALKLSQILLDCATEGLPADEE
ncbi:helix-turn-helix domain-containing protein [Parahaliea mediterranea]|uniref:helix-turn-helix domain-containing protein n=1 Tax=Parahaliea mediterranea TaxID=651086 RepID=UPI000E2E5421|nr:helix-turn-helix transcriptional regulator [Parahaliea mediterranea]